MTKTLNITRDMTTNDFTPKNIVRSWAAGHSNFMTENVERYGWIKENAAGGTRLAYELAYGKFCGKIVWGVTVVRCFENLNVTDEEDLCKGGITREEAEAHIKKLQARKDL